MPLDIIIGTQWGDEGKGRIVDLLSARAEVVARFNGGDNAGQRLFQDNFFYGLPFGCAQRKRSFPYFLRYC